MWSNYFLQIFDEEITVFSQMGARSTGYCYEKCMIIFDLTPYTKFNSKWITYLNAQSKK